MGDTTVEVAENAAEHRYEARVDGALAGFAAYRDDEAGRRVFTHTEVGDEWEGKGVGSALAHDALEDVERRGLRIIARCPFIAAYLERHEEYAGLLA